MAVRRVVTAEVDGRSRVVIDDDAPHTWCDDVWLATADEPLGADPAGVVRPNEAPAGTTTFRIVTLPPDAEMRAALAANPTEGVAADGFHRTKTIDYVFILDGSVDLALDDGSVHLQPGDCVVQRETNHAWRNHNDHPIRLLAVMVSTA
jgi:mannose-6-phosphate isomerase-like protein (cupin superfamily)